MQRWFTTAKLPFSFAQRMEQSLHFFFTMAFRVFFFIMNEIKK